MRFLKTSTYFKHAQFSAYSNPSSATSFRKKNSKFLLCFESKILLGSNPRNPELVVWTREIGKTFYGKQKVLIYFGPNTIHVLSWFSSCFSWFSSCFLMLWPHVSHVFFMFSHVFSCFTKIHKIESNWMPYLSWYRYSQLTYNHQCFINICLFRYVVSL